MTSKILLDENKQYRFDFSNCTNIEFEIRWRKTNDKFK